MRPRDLTRKTWHDHEHEFVTRSGLRVFIAWGNQSVSLTTTAAGTQCSVTFSKRCWNHIVDWLDGLDQSGFWKSGKPERELEHKQIDQHVSVRATKYIYTEGAVPGLLDKRERDHTVAFKPKPTGTWDMQMWIIPTELRQITKWYNSSR